MSRDAGGENGNVVSSLEHAHDSPLGVGLGDLDDLRGQDLEVLDLETQVADRVLGVGVEARADQNELGLDAVGQRLRARRGTRRDSRLERCRRAGGCSACGPGPAPVPVSSLAPVPG